MFLIFGKYPEFVFLYFAS